jgi:hypothetical protein
MADVPDSKSGARRVGPCGRVGGKAEHSAGHICHVDYVVWANGSAARFERQFAQAVQNSHLRHLADCISRIDGRTTASSPRPKLDAPQIHELFLHPGEILFLPIGCLHYVEALDISVTVSFTNFVFDNEFSCFYAAYGAV